MLDIQQIKGDEQLKQNDKNGEWYLKYMKTRQSTGRHLNYNFADLTWTRSHNEVVKSFDGWRDKGRFVTVWPFLGPAGANTKGKREKFVMERIVTLSVKKSEADVEHVCHRALFLGLASNTVSCVWYSSCKANKTQRSIKWTRQKNADWKMRSAVRWFISQWDKNIINSREEAMKTSSPRTRFVSKRIIEV